LFFASFGESVSGSTIYVIEAAVSPSAAAAARIPSATGGQKKTPGSDRAAIQAGS
jgi:hypothetical protein